jgi:hypothetical protein
VEILIGQVIEQLDTSLSGRSLPVNLMLALTYLYAAGC